MAPTTRSSGKPKSEVVAEPKSSKVIKKKVPTKKPTEKKAVKQDKASIEQSNLEKKGEDEILEKESNGEVVESPEIIEKKSTKKPVKSTKKSKVEEVETEQSQIDAQTIYEFTVKDIDGNEVSLEKYKGHVCIIVNVASRCGHTKSNYEQFVQLYDKYSETNGLRILAFPCNQFGSQEAGTCEKIKAFADNKGVKFDMFDKINVNGKNASPLWAFLKDKLPEVTSGKATGKDIKWNFTKFIIDKEGVPVERYASSTKPITLVESLEKLW